MICMWHYSLERGVWNRNLLTLWSTVSLTWLIVDIHSSVVIILLSTYYNSTPVPLAHLDRSLSFISRHTLVRHSNPVTACLLTLGCITDIHTVRTPSISTISTISALSAISAVSSVAVVAMTMAFAKGIAVFSSWCSNRSNSSSLLLS